MSSVNNVLNNGQQMITNYNVDKIFVFGNGYDKANYTNNTYDTVTLAEGTLMGRISATQEIVPLDSSATDGSQYPVGVLAVEAIVEEGVTIELPFCTSGEVVEELVVLATEGDTMSTVISGRSIRDRIAADTVGIKLVGNTAMTATDNQ